MHIWGCCLSTDSCFHRRSQASMLRRGPGGNGSDRS
jgi:hypothetical protein